MTVRSQRRTRKRGGWYNIFTRRKPSATDNYTIALANLKKGDLEPEKRYNSQDRESLMFEIMDKNADATTEEIIDNLKNTYKEECRSWRSSWSPYCRNLKSIRRGLKNEICTMQSPAPQMIFNDNGELDAEGSIENIDNRYKACCPKNIFGMKNRKRVCKFLQSSRENLVNEQDYYRIRRGGRTKRHKKK